MPLPSSARMLRARRLGLALILAGQCVWAAAFDLQGHRGARGLAPENTMAGFERALEVGVSTLELDVAITADGVPVITHDPALNPDLTRDASGQWLPARGPLVHRLTREQLRAFDVGRIRPQSTYARDFAQQQPRDGERIPALAELFEWLKSRGANAVRLNIEFKINPTRPDDTADPAAFVKAVLAQVDAYGLRPRVTFQSFDWRPLQVAQELAPDVATAYLSAQRPRFDTISDGAWTASYLLVRHGSVPAMVKAAGGRLWSPNFNDLTAALVKEAQQHGLKVIPWTVNEPRDMERLIGWGVDGLITDYPDRLREVMARSGLALPAPLTR